jgi:hypothetical protein
LRGATATKQSSSPRQLDCFAHARNDALNVSCRHLGSGDKRTPASHSRSLLQLDVGVSLRIIRGIQAAAIGLQHVVD